VFTRGQRLIVLGVLCFAFGNVARGDAPAQAEVDLERKRANLLQVHRNVRDAHFKTNVDLLLERTSDELIYVRD
jgi:hypothetical protein